MSEKAVKFHRAAFGGFQRQDVVSYIEESALEHAQQLQSLRGDLEEAESRAEEATATAEQNAELADSLLLQLQAVTEERNALAEQVRSLSAQVEELSALQEEAKQVCADAEAYRQLKTELAEIELDARRRAASIVQNAETSAQQKEDEASALLSKISGEVSRAKADTGSTLDGLIHQLKQLRAAQKEKSSSGKEKKHHD